jgi:hypothetical protein
LLARSALAALVSLSCGKGITFCGSATRFPILIVMRSFWSKCVDLLSDALPFGRLWYGEPDAISNAIDYAKANRLAHGANCCFQFHKRGQLFIRMRNEALSVVAMCVSNPDRSPLRIDS